MALATGDASSVTPEQRARAVLTLHEHNRAAWRLGWRPRDSMHLWFYPDEHHRALVRDRIDMGILDVMSALERGADLEARGGRQSAMNILHAVRHALYRTSGGESLLTKLERAAVTYIDDEIPDGRVPVPRDHRHLKKKRNTLHGAKAYLLQSIKDVLRNHKLDTVTSVSRLSEKALRAIRENVRPNDPMAERTDPRGVVSMEVTIAFYVSVTGGLLASVLASRAYMDRVATVEATIYEALRCDIHNAEQLGRAALYAIGMPWKETKNFFATV